jgi:hypothetical protein
MLAFDFYRKYQFMTKTDQNSIFYGHESHIPCRLHIVVMHINFYGLKKKSNFGSNPKVLALSLQKNASLRQNLTETLYSRSVIHNDIVYDFYEFLKNSNFNSKSKGVSLRFYRKT